MAYLILFSTLVLLMAAQNGEALQCWTCSSDTDISCYDPFNTTKFLQMRSFYQQSNYYNQQRPGVNTMPILKDCNVNNFGDQVYDRKAMCIKRVMRLPYDKILITRDCRQVNRDQQTGTCSDRNSNVEFCEYCDYDGCNAASGLTTNAILAAALPTALLLFLRR